MNVNSGTLRRVTTIGHSSLALADFLELLGSAGVAAVADVRRFPGSRRHPHFGGDELARSLGQHGLTYRHLPELGGRRSPKADSPNRGWTQAAFRGYADHLRSDEFARGLQQLEALASTELIAIMCAEGLWWRCHRRLIADVLVLRGWGVEHVLPDGRRPPHELPRFAIPGPDGLPSYPEGAQTSLL